MWLVAPKKGPRTQTNVSVTTSATLLNTGKPSRKSVTFQNTGSETVYVGPSTVTNSGANRGFALFAGTSFTDTASDGDWYAISTSTTNIVHVIEVV